MHATDPRFFDVRRSWSCVPSRRMWAQHIVGSALQSLTGSWHTEQTNASPSLRDNVDGVAAISVSTVFNLLSNAGLECRFAFLATNTVAYWKKNVVLLLEPVEGLHVVRPFEGSRIGHRGLTHTPLHLFNGEVLMFNHPFIQIFQNGSYVLRSMFQEG